jgi:hypothetical protein
MNEDWSSMSESNVAYTVADTPEVVRRIEGDLKRIQEVVQGGDPRLRALVLTGGFARGEGAVVQGVPQNDYDLVAVRSFGPTRETYERMRARLETELGIHIDLAPVGAWRLRFCAPSIFWYETALRGRVLWGDPVLSRIPHRGPEGIARSEGLRLLVNRAAGLLFITRESDPHAHRIQASKGLLAAMDVHLMSRGFYAPSQIERRRLYKMHMSTPDSAGALRGLQEWIDWGFRFKVMPEACEPVDAGQAWRRSAEAVLASVPVALKHAGFSSLEELQHSDRWIDAVYYASRSKGVLGSRRFHRHPTARVRVATLRLLESVLNGNGQRSVQGTLDALVDPDADPLEALGRLRAATLQ